MIKLGTTIYEPTTPVGYWEPTLVDNSVLNFATDLPDWAQSAKTAILVPELLGSLPHYTIVRFVEKQNDDDFTFTYAAGMPLSNFAVYQIRPNAIKKFQIAKAFTESNIVKLHLSFYI